MSNLLISLDKLLILLSQCICLNIIFYLIQINYLWCLSRYLKFRSNNIVKRKIWFLLTDINPLLNSDFLFFLLPCFIHVVFYLYFLCSDSLKREHFKVWNKAYRHFFFQLIFIRNWTDHVWKLLLLRGILQYYKLEPIVKHRSLIYVSIQLFPHVINIKYSKLFRNLMTVVKGHMPLRIWEWNSEVTLTLIYFTSKHSQF